MVSICSQLEHIGYQTVKMTDNIHIIHVLYIQQTRHDIYYIGLIIINRICIVVYLLCLSITINAFVDSQVVNVIKAIGFYINKYNNKSILGQLFKHIYLFL